MGDSMALYLAMQIEEGKLDYKAVMTNPKLARLKGDVDLILTADGRQDLIVPIP